MGLSLETVQNLIELKKLGHFDNFDNVIEFGSQELHLTKADFIDLMNRSGFDDIDLSQFKNIENWPKEPRCSAKNFYSLLGIKNYYSFDINKQHNSIDHDYNERFLNKEFYSKFDLVTDFCACGHAFNIGEAYRTIHNICKTNGIIIGVLPLWKGNGYYLYDHHFFEGLSAANNYSIIYSSYIVSTDEKTKTGSDLAFHVPLNRSLLDTFNLSKNSNNEFKFPYQGKFDNIKYNHYGFNRLYHQNPIGYSYVPTFDLKNIKAKKLIDELKIRIKNKIKFF